MRPDEHPDDLLSAHVDGELEGAVDAEVAAHVAGCAGCQEAVDDLLAARAALRSLPPEDAASVIEGFLGRHRATIRLGVGFVGVASLVLAALALNAATHRAEVVPDVDALVAVHEAASHDEMADVEPQRTAPYAAPPGLIGSSVALSRQAMYDGTDLGAVIYRDGDVAVTVYQQPGRLDRDALPAGTVERIAGEEVWFRSGRPVVAVTEKGDLVVTVVSDHRAGVLTAVGGLPEWRRRQAWDRVHDACQRLTRVFALSG